MANKIVVDCATGARTLQPLSQAEERRLADMQQFAAQQEAALQAAADQRRTDLATLRAFADDPANTSPVWAALARLLGAA